MADISNLEGIQSDEVEKFCRAGIDSVELFLAQVESRVFFTYMIACISIETDIKPVRLIELLPPEHIPVDLLPDELVENLAVRALREAPHDDPWLKRCRSRLNRFIRGLKGCWLGWQQNLVIIALVPAILFLVALTIRATGGFQWLPTPLSLRERVLISGENMPAGKVLKSSDLYSALLPPETEYFKPIDKLDGLILARPVSAGMPLRFRDVLRPQVVAARDIQANAIIQKEDVVLSWTSYRPGVAQRLEDVYGRKSIRAVRKDGELISEFIKPVE